MKISFSWSTLPDPDSDGVFVLESVEGVEDSPARRYGPIPRYAVESFIKARREHAERVAKRHNAVRIITPQTGTLQ